MTKDRRLGKGLAALLGTPVEGEAAYDPAAHAEAPSAELSVEPVTASREPGNGLIDVSVYEIDNNPFQPRREFNDAEIASLAESLKEHEQLQPVPVRKIGDRYQLISGERRLRAAIHAGLATVKAQVRDADDRLVAELAIIENLQRKDLNPIEKAMSFRRYIDQHSCTQSELAERLKIDRSTVANLMRLLELPEEVLAAVTSEKISAGHARALLPLGDEDQQRSVVSQIIEETWSVRQTERFVSDTIQAEDEEEAGLRVVSPSPGRKPVPPQIATLQQQLRMQLGTKVDIKQTAKGRGKIVVHFTNHDEFERLLEHLAASEPVATAAA